MDYRETTWYSARVNRHMNIKIYGWGGTPILVFPCQDSMSNNFADFGMIDTISDFINNGNVQLFCVDTIDTESWSDVNNWDKCHRSWRQECYYNYIIEEVVPFIMNNNNSGWLPVALGCSLGATHAAIVALRRPDLFGGCLAMSGAYDATYFFDGWMDENLYKNSPVNFVGDLPWDHWYLDLYRQRNIMLIVGQGAWEDEGRRTTAIMRDIFAAKGVNATCDFWGYDVDHDWPWWKVQIRYYLPRVF